jgi:hypothetical protein
LIVSPLLVAYFIFLGSTKSGEAHLHAQIGADFPTYNGDDSWELPVTGTFLVDQARTVRLASVDPNFFHPLDPPVVIAHLKELMSSPDTSSNSTPKNALA